MRIGVTLGDPSGIGPELVAAALARGSAGLAGSAGIDDLIVYGDRGVLERAAAIVGVRLPSFALIEVTQLGAFSPGVPTRETGLAQLAYLARAVADARGGQLDALVTAPLHKSSALAAGFAFPGHTELLARELAGGGPVTMMFSGPRLRVSLATIHVPLAAVPRALTVAGLATTIVQTAESLVRDFGVERPRLAVAGLNPHAGESGHFGDEEIRLVEPAVLEARARLAAVAVAGAVAVAVERGGGATVTGPHVPDAVFRQHLDGRFDAVVALYHDQGLIPVKLIDFEDAVNVTLGLSIVRTSPDHGVAHDIAGQGRARSTSFDAALRLARELAHRRSSVSCF